MKLGELPGSLIIYLKEPDQEYQEKRETQVQTNLYKPILKMINKDLDRPMEEISQITGPDLWLQFIHRNPEFLNEYQQIDQFVENIQQRAKIMDEEEQRNDQILRRTNYLIIRKIPGYEYFQTWKHQWRNCTSHNTLMTKEHILTHLESFHQDLPKRLIKIINYANDEKGNLIKRVQKAITDQMKEISKTIQEIISEHCEKYKRKIKIQL